MRGKRPDGRPWMIPSIRNSSTPSYAQGRYLLFSLRIDRKSVPPALLRLKILEAERNKLLETGQKKLYKEQREAIREAVRLDLVGRTLPAPPSSRYAGPLRKIR